MVLDMANSHSGISRILKPMPQYHSEEESIWLLRSETQRQPSTSFWGIFLSATGQSGCELGKCEATFTESHTLQALVHRCTTFHKGRAEHVMRVYVYIKQKG